MVGTVVAVVAGLPHPVYDTRNPEGLTDMARHSAPRSNRTWHNALVGAGLTVGGLTAGSAPAWAGDYVAPVTPVVVDDHADAAVSTTVNAPVTVSTVDVVDAAAPVTDVLDLGSLLGDSLAVGG